MNRYARRGGIGLLAGAAGGPILAATLDDGLPGLLLGALAGLCYALAFPPAARSYAGGVATAAALGVPAWAVVSVVALPLLAGGQPRWTAGGMLALLPVLVGWVFYGAVVGLLVRALQDLALRWLGPEAAPPAFERNVETRVVIVGGGFAGVTTAEELERRFGADPSVEITLISDTNALLFTPMLPEVAAGSLEPTHISSPLRTSLKRTTVVRGRVSSIDLEGRRVLLEPDGGPSRDDGLPYDHLVLAVGSVSDYHGMEDLREEALDFKTLADAIRIRNHVIELFERADRESDPDLRRPMLNLVVAGGGFAGAELAGGLNDFARGMLALYPNVPREELRVTVLHSRDRILPELGESLAAYALERMEERGVTFKLGTRVAGARPGVVVLDSDEEIRTDTLVWTAGTTPNPLLKDLPVEHDKRGAVTVDGNLAVPGYPGVWALGDCAAVTDTKTGEPCPPTAQFALREARALARNVHAGVRRRPLKPFHFDGLGTLCVVGHQTACAEIKGFKFSGLLAWMLWRAVYLSKLPGPERKVRVFVDWNIELFFPRDIVQTIEVD